MCCLLMKSGQKNFSAHGNATLKITAFDKNVAPFSGKTELRRLGFRPHQLLIIHFIKFIKAHLICRIW